MNQANEVLSDEMLAQVYDALPAGGFGPEGERKPCERWVEKWAELGHERNFLALFARAAVAKMLADAQAPVGFLTPEELEEALREVEAHTRCSTTVRAHIGGLVRVLALTRRALLDLENAATHEAGVAAWARLWSILNAKLLPEGQPTSPHAAAIRRWIEVHLTVSSAPLRWQAEGARELERHVELLEADHRTEVESLKKEVERLKHGWKVATEQATNCARCGVFKHTPWRAADGYVCAGCLGAEVERLTKEHDGQVEVAKRAVEDAERCEAERDAAREELAKEKGLYNKQYDRANRAERNLATVLDVSAPVVKWAKEALRGREGVPDSAPYSVTGRGPESEVRLEFGPLRTFVKAMTAAPGEYVDPKDERHAARGGCPTKFYSYCSLRGGHHAACEPERAPGHEAALRDLNGLAAAAMGSAAAMETEEGRRALEALQRDRHSANVALDTANATVAHLNVDLAGCRTRVDGLVQENIRLQGERDAARRSVRLAHAPREDVWEWQGDGSDHPESMVNDLPVVMAASTLRSLVADADALRASRALAQDVELVACVWLGIPDFKGSGLPPSHRASLRSNAERVVAHLLGDLGQAQREMARRAGEDWRWLMALVEGHDEECIDKHPKAGDPCSCGAKEAVQRLSRLRDGCQFTAEALARAQQELELLRPRAARCEAMEVQVGHARGVLQQKAKEARADVERYAQSSDGDSDAEAGEEMATTALEVLQEALALLPPAPAQKLPLRDLPQGLLGAVRAFILQAQPGLEWYTGQDATARQRVEQALVDVAALESAWGSLVERVERLAALAQARDAGGALVESLQRMEAHGPAAAAAWRASLPPEGQALVDDYRRAREAVFPPPAATGHSALLPHVAALVGSAQHLCQHAAETATSAEGRHQASTAARMLDSALGCLWLGATAERGAAKPVTPKQ